MSRYEKFSYIEEQKSKNEEFKSLVQEIDRKIESLIEIRNSERSYNPKDSTCYAINIKVKAVKMTKEEERTLLEYLKDKYLYKVKGNYFTIKKCLFSCQYKIKSKEVKVDFDFDY